MKFDLIELDILSLIYRRLSKIVVSSGLINLTINMPCPIFMYLFLTLNTVTGINFHTFIIIWCWVVLNRRNRYRIQKKMYYVSVFPYGWAIILHLLSSGRNFYSVFFVSNLNVSRHVNLQSIWHINCITCFETLEISGTLEISETLEISGALKISGTLESSGTLQSSKTLESQK